MSQTELLPSPAPVIRQAVILAGGRATRLGARAGKIPKSLLPVAGRPFLDYQLDLLAASQVESVILCLGHLADQFLPRYAGAWKKMSLILSIEAEPLGTGGAIRHALPHLHDRFLVLYGDSFLPFDYTPMARVSLPRPDAAIMAVFHNRDQWDASNVAIESGLVSHYAKMGPGRCEYIDAGISLLPRAAVAAWPEARFDLSVLLAELIRQQRLAAWETPGRFYEIGSHAGLAELEAYLTHAR